MKSWLIKDTTKEERNKIVDGAIVVSMLDSQEPSQETKDIFQKYIDGTMEIEEIQKEIIKQCTESDNTMRSPYLYKDKGGKRKI